MSVIVRSENNKIYMFTKGADTVIQKLISENVDLVRVTCEHISAHARMGLRTLMVTYKEISENDYDRWHNDFKVNLSDYIIILPLPN